jgi:nucleotide-binding universal stress UspA family protein
MFRRILVPLVSTDESTLDDHGLRAVHVAGQLARRTGACLTVLRIPFRDEHSREIVRDDSQIERLTSALQAQGIDAHALTCPGYAEDVIAEIAEERHTELVVFALYHEADLRVRLAPDVTSRLFLRAPAPLLLWPEHLSTVVDECFLNRSDSLVLVPLDGCELAEQAIPCAVGFAREYRRRLLLLHAVPGEISGTAAGHGYQLVRGVSLGERREAARYLSRMTRRLAARTGVGASYLLRYGEPSSVILRVASEHMGSLIVMSTHGCADVAPLPLGGVAADVLHATPAPMVLISPHAAAQYVSRMAWLLLQPEAAPESAERASPDGRSSDIGA